jgi:hypothetical protein
MTVEFVGDAARPSTPKAAYLLKSFNRCSVTIAGNLSRSGTSSAACCGTSGAFTPNPDVPMIAVRIAMPCSQFRLRRSPGVGCDAGASKMAIA